MALAVLLCSATTATARDPQNQFHGARLEEALRTLQKNGLQIVFSSEIVTPDMVVAAEPHASTLRGQLDELLEPHGLKAQPGPGGIIQIVRAKPIVHATSATVVPQKPAFAIRGQIIEALTFIPIAGALVQVVDSGESVLSDKHGRFGLETAAASRTLTISRMGYTPVKHSLAVRGSNFIVIELQRAVEGYVEQVTVRGAAGDGTQHRATSELTLDVAQLQLNRGVLEDDGGQVVRGMPNVTAGDDFRSEFSVRGSPYRQVGIVVDGVATPWLKHNVYGHSDAGSLSMFGVDTLDRATLRAGAYPQRYGDVLGAELELSLREGSRESSHFAGSLGGTSAALSAEGPVGLAKRGSWIVSARNSYIDWPVRRHRQSDMPFSFADAYAKVVYDVTSRQQIAFAAIGGRSTIDGSDDPSPGQLSTGLNQAALLSGSWRATLGSRGALRQRLSLVMQDSSNKQQGGLPGDGARNREFAYRSELFHDLFGGRLETGAELRWMHGARDFATGSEPLSADWSMRSAYAHFDRVVGRGVSMAGGLRFSDSSLVHRHSLSRWILADWGFKPGWSLSASASVSHQLPDLEHLQNFGTTPVTDLRPETAANIDVGVQQRFARTFRWQATLFRRVEHDLLRAPLLAPRLSSDVFVDAPVLDRYENALRGNARGLEVLIGRDSTARLSGWVSYAHGRTRQTDNITGESFWGDFDRRHAFNASAIYRLPAQTRIAVVFRSSTNAPIPGYFSQRRDGLFVGDRRNDVRLPAYARLDTRLQRTYLSSTRRITLFAEVLNILNRENQGVAAGIIDRSTGQALGFTRSMLARRASAGIVVGF